MSQSNRIISGAIFDMDGTILDSSGIWEDAQFQIMTELGYVPKPTLKDDVFPLSGAETAAFLIKDYNMKESEETVNALIDEKISSFYFYHAVLKPGALDFLKHLHYCGIPIALVTATGRRYVEPAMKRAGILDLFTAVLPTDEYKTDKFKADIFFEAVRQLGSDYRTTWVFEDAPHAIHTASKAGFPTCAVKDPATRKDWNYLKCTADYFLPSFLSWRDIPLYLE